MERLLLPMLVVFAACRTDDPEIVNSPDGDVTDVSPIPQSATYLPEAGPSDPVRAIFIGDSITAGFGAGAGLAYTELLEANDHTVWPEHDREDLESSYGSMEIVNVAIPGATTANVVVAQLDALEDALGEPPWSGETVVFMTAGGNDLQFAIPRLLEEGDDAAAEILPEMERNVETVLDFFDDPALFPDGAYVHFTNVYEPTDNQGQAGNCLNGTDIGPLLGYLEDTNTRFQLLAEERDVAMLDIRTAFLGHGFFAEDPSVDVYREDDPTTWFAADCIHPNERGHHEIRRLFWGALHGEVR